MEGTDRSFPQRLSQLLAAGPFVAAAGIVLLFDVLRDIPLDYGCGEQAPAGHGAAVASYRSGAWALHLLAIGWALGAIALLGARIGRGGGPFAIGLPTVLALGLAVAAVPIAVFAGDGVGSLVLIPLALVAVGLAVLAQPFGAQVTGILAASVLLLAAAWWMPRAIGAGRALARRAALWALVGLAGAHLLIVFLQGDGIHIC